MPTLAMPALSIHDPLSAQDMAALAIFAVAWLLYEPILKRVARRAG